MGVENPSVAAAAPQSNYTGSVIFLSYILAALAVTYSIIAQLRAKLHQEDVHARLSLRVLIACISFTVLSFNMSAFLFVSYNDWTHQAIGKRNVFRWMLQTGLFTDFAQELVSDSWTSVWITAALLWTNAINVWLAIEGRRNRIKNLWKYFVVAQILPVSFAQSLFAIDLDISRSLKSTSTKQDIGSKTTDQRSATTTSEKEHVVRDEDSDEEAEHDDAHVDLNLGPSMIDGPDAAVITFTSIATMYMIHLLPLSADKPEFMYLVIVTRLLLFAPYIVALRQEEPEDGGMDPMDAAFYVAVIVVPIALLAYTTVGRVSPEEENVEAAMAGLHKGMATRALGYDLFIGLSSALLMLWGVA